jgi:hypothetical protein
MTTIACRQFVELVTAHLDHSLTAPREREFRRHARLCPGCRQYLEQTRSLIQTMRTLAP